MIYVHYDRITGKVLGAFHSSVNNIPRPNIKVSDVEWSKAVNSDVSVDLVTRKLVVKEHEKTNDEIDALRREAYIKESDPLFFKYQRKECTKKDWLNKIEEIKKRYPKK